MIQIKKADVQQILLEHYRQQLRDDLEAIFAYEQKYEMSFEEFTEHEKGLAEEDFEKADDQMHWEGLVHFVKETYSWIKSIEDGLFEPSTFRTLNQVTFSESSLKNVPLA